MTAATASLYLMLTATLGTIHGVHTRNQPDCHDCGAEQATVREEVGKLRTAKHWTARRKAARALRAHDWKQYPEAVEALSGALLNDRQGLVRQEAAESLGKMKPCLPVAHEALACASEKDSCLLARHAARKALKSVGKFCEEPCDVCGFDSIGGETILPPIGVESGEPEFSPLPETSFDVPATTLTPLGPDAPEVPAAPLGSSPFVPNQELPIPPRPPVGLPRIHPEDDLPLIAPEAPIDRYNPRPAEPPPTPLSRVIPPPKPAWPR
ncbi:HEAT repeat domain-containing protein [Planctomyces sp. SH-PL62]|uniref:HEAT repeat domain-containing protein n=1 Tax=Planctomyces sp. SH-PL62 TaxID=1636152 RepID=UPI00078D61F3|nr:HEAT repeat domain-containing protein [Planctomyces sp. SH-PL62]AMV39027.1 hypothetical protein VT85_16440 [Planctomyces sp. SH-PL62]